VRCFITVFTTNKGTTIAKARAMGLDEVEQMIRRDPPKLSKDNLRLLKFAKFGDRKTERGSLRHNANVLTITGIEGDCDDDKTPMQWAVNRLRAAGIQSLLYTSPSHEPGGAGRWRVLCPLAAAIKDELDKQHRYWVGVLNAYLGGVLGKESFTLSQSYYFGRIIGRPDPEIVRLDGRCIDELPDHPEPNYGPNGAGNGADHHHDAASGSDGERLTESELTATLANIGADDYHRWIGVGQILKADYDTEPDRWIEWSKKSTKFKNERECRAKWRTFNGLGLTTGTLIHWAGGHVPKPSPEEDFVDEPVQIADDDVDDADDDILDSEPSSKAKKRDAIPVLTASTFLKRWSRPQWRIKNLLPESGLALVFGASGSGKTFLTLDLVAGIVSGAPWGRNELLVRKGRAVYVAAEGPGGFRNRVDALKQDGRDLDGLFVIPAAPLITTDKAVDALIDAIRDKGGADVIVLDTLSQVTSGLDENSSDMSRALRAANRLREEFHCLVIFVGHSGKDPAKGHRGWSGIRNATDTEIEVTRADYIRTAKVTKQKDGEEGARYSFILRQVKIGVDDDGDPITTCLLEHCDTPIDAPRAKRPSGHNQTIVYQAIRECIKADGTAMESDVIAKAAPQLPRADGRNRQREHARQAIKGLAERGVVICDNGQVRVRE